MSLFEYSRIPLFGRMKPQKISVSKKIFGNGIAESEKERDGLAMVRWIIVISITQLMRSWFDSLVWHCANYSNFGIHSVTESIHIQKWFFSVRKFSANKKFFNWIDWNNCLNWNQLFVEKKNFLLSIPIEFPRSCTVEWHQMNRKPRIKTAAYLFIDRQLNAKCWKILHFHNSALCNPLAV